MPLPHTALSSRIDTWLARIGSAISWIWVALTLVVVVNVLLRQFFDQGQVELEELQWHLYATGFLLGLSYAYQADTHVRVDVLHERWSLRMQAWVELYGILLFLLPFVALILWFSVPFVAQSYALSEISQAPGGLPLRWLIKAVLPLGFLLLLLGVVARLIRVWHYLFLRPVPVTGGEA